MKTVMHVSLPKLSLADHSFLVDLVALFTDPDRTADLADLRAHAKVIGYVDGSVRLIDVPFTTTTAYSPYLHN